MKEKLPFQDGEMVGLEDRRNFDKMKNGKVPK